MKAEGLRLKAKVSGSCSTRAGSNDKPLPNSSFAAFRNRCIAPEAFDFAPPRFTIHRQTRVMKEDSVARITISLPASLLSQLDAIFERKGRANRSQALADIIRDHLVEERKKAGTEEIAGTITLVYDHHKPHVQAALTDIQHDHHHDIISTLHVHLDHHNCMEVLAVRGKANEIQKIADELIAAKGVKHGKLTVTTTGKDMPS